MANLILNTLGSLLLLFLLLFIRDYWVNLYISQLIF